MRSFVIATVAALQIPITNEVIINGRSFGTGSELEPFMDTCRTEVYNPPVDMGVVAKGQTVKVVGAEVKVVLHMRGNCESYYSYDYTVGKCSSKTTAVETVSDEWTADHAIQSLEIVQCDKASVPSDASWEDTMK